MTTAMDRDTAITIINELLVFAPGWRFEAEDYTKRFENTIKLGVHYPACQTNKDQAKDGYPEIIPDVHAGFVVPCDFEDTSGLYRNLLTKVIFPIYHHEAREMARMKPTFWAPFHPHRHEGMQRWGDVDGDLRFGLT